VAALHAVGRSKEKRYAERAGDSDGENEDGRADDRGELPTNRRRTLDRLAFLGRLGASAGVADSRHWYPLDIGGGIKPEAGLFVNQPACRDRRYETSSRHDTSFHVERHAVDARLSLVGCQ
jgi:hypothetical protein